MTATITKARQETERKITFLAVDGSHMRDEQAARYGPELRRLRQAGVKLTARNVVAKAESPRSRLHDWFEWDDSVAGPLWRENQARRMFQSIAVVIEDHSETDPEPQRFFIALHVEEDEQDREYVPLNVVRQDADLEGQMLQTAANELKAFRDKYRRLQGLATVVDWPLVESWLDRLAA